MNVMLVMKVREEKEAMDEMAASKRGQALTTSLSSPPNSQASSSYLTNKGFCG